MAVYRIQASRHSRRKWGDMDSVNGSVKEGHPLYRGLQDGPIPRDSCNVSTLFIGVYARCLVVITPADQWRRGLAYGSQTSALPTGQHRIWRVSHGPQGIRVSLIPFPRCCKEPPFIWKPSLWGMLRPTAEIWSASSDAARASLTTRAPSRSASGRRGTPRRRLLARDEPLDALSSRRPTPALVAAKEAKESGPRREGSSEEEGKPPPVAKPKKLDASMPYFGMVHPSPVAYAGASEHKDPLTPEHVARPGKEGLACGAPAQRFSHKRHRGLTVCFSRVSHFFQTK
jgi:hypothetical protein